MPFPVRRREPDAAPLTTDEARELCLRLLAARARSRSELAERLAAAGAEAVTAEQVLDRLTEVGLVDDAAYASGLARSRRAERGLSRRALTGELRRRGLAEEVVAGAVDGATTEPDAAVALQLAQRRARTLTHLPPDAQRRRLGGYLARRGYGFDVVGPVCAEVLAGLGGGDELDLAVQHMAEHGPEPA